MVTASGAQSSYLCAMNSETVRLFNEQVKGFEVTTNLNRTFEQRMIKNTFTNRVYNGNEWSYHTSLHVMHILCLYVSIFQQLRLEKTEVELKLSEAEHELAW